jgi:hypothetical protein
VLTLIDIQPDADTWFPEWKSHEWQETSTQHFAAEGNDGLAYRILEFRRVK